MALSYQLDIVSATEQIFSGLVSQVFVCGVQGDLEVLYGHAPFLTNLLEGPVTIVKQNGQNEVFYLTGGMLEVQPERTTIFADTVVHAKDLNEAKALEAKQRAEEVIAGKRKDFDFAEAEAELVQAIAQLKALKKLREKGKMK